MSEAVFVFGHIILDKEYHFIRDKHKKRKKVGAVDKKYRTYIVKTSR